jgi:hypothetical protein
MAKHNIDVEVHGEMYKGTYTKFGNEITVEPFDFGRQKVTQIGGSGEPPEILAQIILWERVNDALQAE